MRPPTSWADLRGLRVGVWGVGVEGRASLRRLRADGVEPVIVDRAGSALDDGTEVVAFDAGGQRLLSGADVVIKSPGISRYGGQFRRVAASGVAITGGLALWLGEVDRSRVACITGTKGKSTTTSIAGGLLAGLGCA